LRHSARQTVHLRKEQYDEAIRRRSRGAELFRLGPQ
jgi:hypothetical protein